MMYTDTNTSNTSNILVGMHLDTSWVEGGLVFYEVTASSYLQYSILPPHLLSLYILFSNQQVALLRPHNKNYM